MLSVFKKMFSLPLVGQTYFRYRCMRQHHITGLKLATYVLSFDLDYKEDVLAIPRLLKILRRSAVPASFACVGKWVERYPDIHKAIVKHGHEIMNHTYSHPNNPQLSPTVFFNRLSPPQQKQEIKRCHTICERILDYQPIGFRTPHFGALHTASVYPLLDALGYRYSSSVSAFRSPTYGLPYRIGPIFEIPLGCCIRNPAQLLDSWSRIAPDAFFHSDAQFLSEFREIIASVRKTDIFTTHYFDPRMVVENGLLEKMCTYLKEAGLELTTYRQFLQSDMGKRSTVLDMGAAEQ